jgi:hypothetical protein
MTIAVELPTRATFEALVDESWSVRVAHGEPVSVKLVRVTPGASGRPGEFTLEFDGPSDRPLEQGTYEFAHPRCTSWIFVVPVARTPSGFRYEAVFNS